MHTYNQCIDCNELKEEDHYMECDTCRKKTSARFASRNLNSVKLLKKIDSDTFIGNKETKERFLSTVVFQHPNAIRYIKNPDRKMQITATTRDASTFKYINNPDRAFLLEVATVNGSLIQYIEKPDKDLLLEVLEKNPTAIIHIKDPDTDMQLKAAKKLITDHHSFKSTYKEIFTDPIALIHLHQNQTKDLLK